jgi:hypothetical protein
MPQPLRRRIVGIAAAAAAFAFAAYLALTTASAQSGPYVWRNVEVVGGGFVPGFVFNPSVPDLVYARTDIGGAYRWNPATSRWVPLLDWVSFDDWNLTGVDSLATDPVDPNRLYILAGTYTNAWTTQNGAILRSTDRGNTFQRTNLPFKSGGNMPGRSMGERLAIDPNRNSVLYLGARSGNGLWRSTDFGVTWSRVASFTAVGTYVQQPGDVYLGDIVGVVWVTFDPRSSTSGTATRTIYVGVADKGNSIYRSTDAGATWAPVPGQPTGFLPHHGVLASNGMLYITYSDGAGPYDGTKGDVWRYDTVNGIWTLISPVPSSGADDYFGYGGLAVDAQHPNTILVAALNSWWPDTIIFRSLDSGATWTRIWDWAGYPSRSFRYVQSISGAPWLTFGANPQPPEIAPKLGWMVGDLEIDPFNSNRMLYGTGATIYGADDLTAWDSGGQIHISVKAQGLEETAVLDLISPPAGAPLLSGLGDISGFRHDNLAAVPARMMTTPTFTSTTSLDYAELTPNFIVRVGNADTANGTRRVGFSFDGGTNWFQGIEPGGVTGGGTVAAAANASRVVWSPQGAAVHFSTNNGSSWTQSTGIAAGARVGADRVNPSKFYGFVNGTFYVSTNGGAAFVAAATGLPALAQFKAVPGREGDIWLAGGEGGLWRSTNSGTTFTQVASVQEADTIGFGRAAAGQAYMALYSSAQVAGVRGIFRSDDAGATWVRVNDDQHQYGATTAAITGDPRVYGRVYVSTNGRGIIYGEPTGVSNPDFSLASSPASLTINRGASGTSAIAITRLNGFTGSVAFSASGLPTGVTATFNPLSTTGASSTLTLIASSTATLGSAVVTVTGASGSLSRATSINLTVATPPPADFSVSASPASVSVAAGSTATSTVAIARTGGFAGAVVFSASGLPSGVTASFAPSSTTGASSTVTFSAAASAPAGSGNVTITGTSGSLARTTTVALTVTTTTGGNGGVTVTPVINSSGPWFNDAAVRVNNTSPITALTVTIVIQRTTGISFNGQYNTVGSQITQANSSTASAITYTFTLAAGQTLGAGTNRLFAAQTSGSGTVHATAGDTFTVTYTVGGTNFTQSGHF